MRKPVVFLVCTGLGRINRGYESFTQECFDALKGSDSFDLFLIKGSGKKDKREKVIPNLHRNGKLAKQLAGLFKLPAYSIEQASFCIALLPLILLKKPKLIYYSDFALGSYLWHLRRYFKFNYKLLFCNGAPNGPPYKTEDHIQQLLPVYYDIGVKADGDKLKHTFLPYAFNIDAGKNENLVQSKKALREQLGFSSGQKLILAVGAINSYHKRVDYIINDVAQLPANYFLVMLGQYDNETNHIMQLAKEKLPGRYLIANLNQQDLSSYYAIADIFVLASLHEGFPRVTIEALSHGLPCITHDYVVTKQILGDEGIYIDMRFEGELLKCLQDLTTTETQALHNIQTAYKKYSWDVLKKEYEQMIKTQLNLQS